MQRRYVEPTPSSPNPYQTIPPQPAPHIPFPPFLTPLSPASSILPRLTYFSHTRYWLKPPALHPKPFHPHQPTLPHLIQPRPTPPYSTTPDPIPSLHRSTPLHTTPRYPSRHTPSPPFHSHPFLPCQPCRLYPLTLPARHGYVANLRCVVPGDF